MNRLVVIAGPSGVGKGTIVRRLCELHPDVWLSVSATTRRPRGTEVDGREYHFVSEDEFSRMIADGELLEWATVFGQDRYGTPRAPVEERLAAGVPCVLEIDIDGARQVRRSMPEAALVFIQPPSWQELVRRLEGRGTESSAQVIRRLETARVELAAADEFDHVVVNDTVDGAVEQVNAILRADR